MWAYDSLCPGPTEESVSGILQHMMEHGTEIEMHALFNETALSSTLHNPYRGYCILNSENAAVNVQVRLIIIGCHFSCTFQWNR